MLGAFNVRFWVPRAILPDGGGASFGGCRPAYPAPPLGAPPAEVLRPANRSGELPEAVCNDAPSPDPPFAAAGMLSMLLELCWYPGSPAAAMGREAALLAAPLLLVLRSGSGRSCQPGSENMPTEDVDGPDLFGPDAGTPARQKSYLSLPLVPGAFSHATLLSGPPRCWQCTGHLSGQT